jgi:REP element-mobilizing transposase RayT
MKFNPDIHHRKSIRLPEYDYSQAGCYFVTLCVHERIPLFGNVIDGVMVLNDAGKLIEQWWNELTNKFTDIRLNEYVVMPNHVHGVVEIVGADLCVCPDRGADYKNTGAHAGAPLHTMVQWFKTMSTNEYIHGVNHLGWTAFNGKLWQRNYYERIIRNESELANIREYIHNNSEKWALDELFVM